MDKNIRDIVEIQVAKMPQSVRDALKNADVWRQLALISQKNSLRVDQAGVVEREAMLTLLGLEHPDRLVQNLMREGNFNTQQAEQLSTDINENIFKSVKHALVEMAEADNETDLLRQSLAGSSTALLAPSMQPPLPPRPVETRPAAASVPAPAPSQKPQGLERTMPQDLVRAKLEQSFRLPPEVSTVTLPQGGSDQQKKPAPSVDPYREPIQ